MDDEVNGFLAHPTHHLNMEIKLFSYWKMSNCKEFGVEARKKVTEKFSIAVVVQDSLAFYKSLISFFDLSVYHINTKSHR
jgi:hypothetical protein